MTTYIRCPHCDDNGKRDGYTCKNCSGFKEVELGSPDEFCGHNYYNDRSVGRCLSVWKCAICWHEITIDSS